MKTFSIVVVSLLCSVVAFGQADQPFVEMHCGGPTIRTGHQSDRVRQIVIRLGSRNAVQTVLIQNEIINAWVIPLSNTRTLVCIPLGLVDWLKDSDGELAFIIAHELGHAIDESCKTDSGRARLAAKSRSVFSLLVGRSKGDELADTRSCEMRADALAFSLMVRARIDPVNALTALKKLKAASRDHRKGVLGRLVAIGDDHPIMADRIKQIQRLRETYAQTVENPQGE